MARKPTKKSEPAEPAGQEFRLSFSGKGKLAGPASDAGLELLQGFLLVADKLYRDWRDEPSDRGRMGALMALGAVTDWLQRRRFLPAAVRPLLTLEGALHDLERGVTAPLLEAKLLHHRAPLSHWHHVLRALASVAMTLLMNAGRSRDDAAKWIFKKLAAKGAKLRGRGKRAPSWRTIVRWRDELTGASTAGDDPADRFAVERYRNILAWCEKRVGETPENLAERLLSIAVHEYSE